MKHDPIDDLLAKVAKEETGKSKKYVATPADLIETKQAMGLSNQGRTDDAIQLLNAIIRAQPWNLMARNFLTVLYLETKNYTLAEKNARDAISQWPLEGVAWIHLGMILAGSQRYSAAIDAYLTAIECEEQPDIVWCKIGDIYTTLGKEKEAEEANRNALKTNPNAAGALCFFSIQELKRGHFVESKALFARVESNLPPALQAAAILYNQLAWNVYLLDAKEEVNSFGLELVDKSIAKERSPINLDTRACLLSRLHRYKEAKEGFLAAIEAFEPPQQKQLTWSEFKHVLEILNDKKTLGQFKDYFHNVPATE